MPTNNPMVAAYLRDRNIRGPGVTEEQHAVAFYRTPCVTSTENAVEYALITQGADVKPSLIRKAVKEGDLSAYRIGNGYHFTPKDLDDWLDSLRVSTSNTP